MRDVSTDVNANVLIDGCFVIGQYHGNWAQFDVGVVATSASNVMQKSTSSP